MRGFSLALIAALCCLPLLGCDEEPNYVGPCLAPVRVTPDKKGSDTAVQAKERYMDKVAQRGQRTIVPAVGEPDVRKWFSQVKLAGFKQQSLFCEFHPIDGSLVGVYKAAPDKMLYLAFVDNKRKDPDFGFSRNAHEIVSISAKKPPKTFEFAGRKWFGDDSTGAPIIAVDVTKDVKVEIIGHQNVSLAELAALAKDVPLDPLAKVAKN